MPALLNPAVHPRRAHPPFFNCRVYERQSCQLPVACQPAAALGNEETRWLGTVRDVSQGGIRLTLERRFEPGTGLAVELPQDELGDTRTVLVKVVHVRRQEDKHWSLGCKFISEMSEEEMRRLLLAGDADVVDPNESRLTVHSMPLAVPKVRLQVVVNAVALIDCVADRMVVPSSWPLAAGKTVTVLGGKASGAPWKMKLRVIHCTQQADGWVLRAQLVHAPSAADLLRAVARPFC
jgi:PilZ domain